MWWNVIGFIAAYAVAYPASTAFAPSDPANLCGTLIARADRTAPWRHSRWRPYYLALAAYGAGILVLPALVTIIT